MPRCHTQRRAELGVKGILQQADEMQFKRYEHVKRMSNSRFSHQLLNWKPTSIPDFPLLVSTKTVDIKIAVENRGTTLAEVEPAKVPTCIWTEAGGT